MISAERRARALALLALAAGLAGAAAPARADDNHYQSMLIGDRALGLGGAFTAISDDASGAYYNPAGLAEAPYSSLSLSASVYGYASQSFEIASADFASDNATFISYPTTAAWIQRVRQGGEDGAGRVQLALSLVTPRSITSRRVLAFLTSQPDTRPGSNLTLVAQNTLLLTSEDETLWVGLSGAWKIARFISVGTTAFFTYRTGLHQQQWQAVGGLFQPNGLDVDRSAISSWQDIRLQHFGFLAAGGIIVTPTERLRIGAAFHSPSVEIHGRADITTFATPADQITGQFRVESQDIQGVAFHDRRPFKVSLGGAYLVRRRWGVSADLSLFGPLPEYAPLEPRAAQQLSANVRMKKRTVLQANAGGELYLKGKVPLRLGFFTDLSSLADLQDCAAAGGQQVCVAHENFLTDAVDMFGLTTSVGYEGERATLNLGLSAAFGAHDSRLQNGLELSTFRSNVVLALGGAFRF